MSKNVGEYDEIRIQLRLIELRDQKCPILIDGRPLKITSVGLDYEYSPLPKGINLRNLSDNDIEKLAHRLGAGKASPGAKADVLINGIGYSVKSHRSAPPALVNHTPRVGWDRICNYLGVSIEPLDKMVTEYFRKRRAGIITEDVNNADPNSPFASHLEYLRPILNYFLFTGTGARDSIYPAEYVLDCADPYDISSWKIYDKSNYLDLVWDKLVFSMREKGYSYCTRPSDQWKNKINAPWAQVFDGRTKASLHVRVK